MVDERPMTLVEAMQYANFLINNTTQWNVKQRALVLSGLIASVGDELRKQLVVHFGRGRAANEVNNLELYAEMIQRVKDETLRTQVVAECVKVVKELLELSDVTARVKKKLRNMGAFIGLLTICRDVPITARELDLKRMLVRAAESKDSQRICLVVVLITHVLKDCQRSTIFQKECTWVSRIIAILKELHEREGMDVFVCLEIERFFDQLKQAVPRTASDAEESDEQPDGPPLTDEELRCLRMEDEGAFSPMEVWTPPDYSHELDVELEEQLAMSRSSHSSVHAYPTPEPSAVSYARSSAFFDRPSTPLTHTHVPLPGPAFSSPQPSEGGFSTASEISASRLSAHAAATARVFHPRAQQLAAPVAQPTSAASAPRLENQLIDLVLNRLDFAEIPIFARYPEARAMLLELFLAFVVDLEGDFMKKSGTSITTLIEVLLSRDLLFCNDERQIRQCYQVTSRAVLFAAFQTPTHMADVARDFERFLRYVFMRVLERKGLTAMQVEEMIDVSAKIFSAKNQHILMDCLLMQLNRRATGIADLKLQQAFASSNRLADALAHFAAEPTRVEDVNNRLPAPLRRAYGPLSNKEFAIYASFDTIARMCQRTIERGFPTEAEGADGGWPADYLAVNEENFSPISQSSRPSTAPPPGFSQHGEQAPTTADVKTLEEIERKRVNPSPVGRPPSTPTSTRPASYESSTASTQSGVFEPSNEVPEPILKRVEELMNDWFAALSCQNESQELRCRHVVQTIVCERFLATRDVQFKFVQASFLLCQRLNERWVHEGNERRNEQFWKHLLERITACARAYAFLLRLLTGRLRDECGLPAAVEFVETAFDALLLQARPYARTFRTSEDPELACRCRLVIDTFASFANFNEAEFADEEYLVAFVRVYTNAVYKFDMIDTPELLCVYTALIIDDTFLHTLIRLDNVPGLGVGLLMILVLQVVHLLADLGHKKQLHSLSVLLKRSITRLITKLTEKYPEAFARHYIAFSELLPALTLHYRNQVLRCVPRDFVFPPMEGSFPDLCELPVMNEDPQMRVAPLSQRLDEALIRQIRELMDAPLIREFPKDLLQLFLPKNAVDYNRTAMSSMIVFVAQLAIQRIQGAQQTINMETVGSSVGQQLLFQMLYAMDNAGRYTALVLMVDHLRYPNMYTAFFGSLLLNLFLRTSRRGIREIIARILLERFMPASPFPWGLRAVYAEFVSNPVYEFLQQPFHQYPPKIVELLERAQHILQNPEEDVGPAIIPPAES
ncbi:CCR4-NOT transcription complex subunit 1 [Aphelenchoides fujianensis]|nr:CCR4-NOT transcription complex subunit 1 [Aphelenchoides fujianensis]